MELDKILSFIILVCNSTVFVCSIISYRYIKESIKRNDRIISLLKEQVKTRKELEQLKKL